jgi:hypothetical protein
MSFFSQYPSSAGGSNPSIGTNGATAPTSSTEVGGVGVDGNLHPLSVTNAGILNVNLSSTTTTPLPVTDAAAEASLSSIDGKSTTIATNTGNTATSTATTATNTGNTATSVASIDTKTPTVGQKTMAASSPVVIASDQSSISVAQPDATASGSITIVNSNPNSGTATAGSTVAITALNGQTSWSVQVTGTYTGALTPQCTIDGSNWIALSATAITNINTNAQSATIASASVGIFEISAPPCAQLRITALAAVTGTAVVSLRASSSTTRIGLDSPLPAGAAVIGALTANQSINNAQINGVTPLMGNGVTGTGSQRVTIASDNTAFSVNANAGTNLNTSLLALESGGNLATIVARTPALGAAASASSSPVVIASDQAPSTGYVRSATGNFTATSQTVTINPAGCSTIVVQPSGTFSATYTMETSDDNGTTWTSLFGWDQGNTAFSATGNVAGRIYTYPAYGNLIRARCSTYTSGTMVITMVAGLGSMPAMYVSPVTFFPVQGAAALAATGTGVQPLQIGGLFQTSPATLTNGQQGALQQDSSQNLLVKINASGATVTTKETTSATATNTNVASSATSVTILASNANRLGATVFNDSTQVLYLNLAGNTASATNYTVQLGPNNYYELPAAHLYTGAITGIWASANGNARVTELT